MWPFPGLVLLTELKHGPPFVDPEQLIGERATRGRCTAPQISQGQQTMTHIARFVGIDVGKSHLDIHCHPDGRSWRVANTQEGIAELLAHLRDGPRWLAACEASGGYERKLLLAMSAANTPLYCLHPTDVRAFARFTGTRAKTDPLDARMIAHALEVAHLHRKPVYYSKIRNDLKQLLALRRHLASTLTDLKGLATQTDCPSARALITHRMAQAKVDLQNLQKTIKSLIAADEAATHTAKLVRSVPGAGEMTSVLVLASMPELGTISHKQAASLAGVAPHPRQSGKTNRGGRCQGGRRDFRRCLYMAALSAIKARAPSLYPFYKRLRDAGKPFKLAITAAMRKLVIQINATLTKQAPFLKTQ